MSRSREHGKTTFQTSWMQDDRFKHWLKPGKEPGSAICSFCNNAVINVEKMGVSALVSHSQGKKHKQVASTNSPLSVSHAEIKWTMKVVLSHFSLGSCLDLNKLFQEMFPDSVIAKSFQLNKTKCGYLVTYGIAPYLKSKLMNSIQSSPFFTILFVESFNTILQEEQMDIHLRYWSDNESTVQTRYLESMFLKHANAENMSQELIQSVSKFKEENLLMVSMDALCNTRTVMEILSVHRKDNQLPLLFEFGNCSLHVVREAFQAALAATNWNLDKILHAMWKFLHDSPARRDVYRIINQSPDLPLPFCKTRWIEDVMLAARTINIWPYIVKLIEHYQSLPTSKRPLNNKFYDLLVACHVDKLMPAKFQFFHDLAHILSGFLKQFKTDKPLLPFIADVLESILRRLLKMFMPLSHVMQAATSYELIKVNVKSTRHCLPPIDVKLTTATEALINASSASDLDKLKFKKQCTQLLVSTAEKIQERSPLKFQLVRCMNCIVPKHVIHLPEACSRKFGIVVDNVYINKHLDSKEADDAKIQFDEFLDMAKRYKDDFIDFDPHEDRLDVFYGQWLHHHKSFKSMWKVFIFMFTLSHGQSQIETDFSINSDLLVENLKPESLCAQHTVYDYIKHTNKEIHEIEIDNDLVLSCEAAHGEYQAALQKAKAAVETEKYKKRSLIIDEIEDAKRRKMELSTCIETLTKDYEKYYDLAEEEDDKSLYIKANAVRRSVAEKKKIVSDLENTLAQLEKEKEDL